MKYPFNRDVIRNFRRMQKVIVNDDKSSVQLHLFWLYVQTYAKERADLHAEKSTPSEPTVIPCPFCGGKVIRYFVSEYKWGAAICNNCGATGPDVRTNYDTSDDAPWHKEALNAWNTRETK